MTLLKKMIIAFISLSIAAVIWALCTISISAKTEDPKELVMERIEKEIIEPILEVQTEDPIVEEMKNKMSEIESISDMEEWYIEYKKIVEEYADKIDPPESIYNVFTEDEIYLIQRTVETECYDQDFLSKCNVASVIFNRIELADLFGDSVKEVITAPKQFAYGKKTISDSTKLAVEFAYQIMDTTNGCIGFHSNKKTNTFNNWKYSFTDNIGHHFYYIEEAE